MANNNDGKLPIVYRSEEHQGKDKDQSDIMSNREGIRGHQQGVQASQPSYVSHLINAVGPDFTILGQHGGGQSMGSYQGQMQGNHPALFGQNQLKDDFGPVYAIPPFPSHYSHNQGTGSSPWHHNQGQGMGDDQWQQWDSHHQATIPYCCYYPYYMYTPFGHRW